jgi:hypothetical protein
MYQLTKCVCEKISTGESVLERSGTSSTVKMHLWDFDEDGLCANFALLRIGVGYVFDANEGRWGSRDPFDIPGFYFGF